jgi:CHAT domain-containing protein
LTEAVLAAEELSCLDNAIACLRDARNSWPSFHHLSFKFELAKLLVARFLRHQVDEDYNDAKDVLDSIIPPPPRTRQNSCDVRFTTLSSALKMARLIVYSTLEDDWEEAVSRCNSFLEHCTSSFGNPLHPVIAKLLEDHSKRVSKQFASSQGAQTGLLEVDHLPFFTLGTFGDGVDGSDIVPAAFSPTKLQDKIDELRGLCHTATVGTDQLKAHLERLASLYLSKLISTDDTTCIEEAILCYERLRAVTHPTETDTTKSRRLSNFGKFLYEAFHRTNRGVYLNKSIDNLREILGLENARRAHFSTIQQIIYCLSIRGLRGQPEDLEEVMGLFDRGVRGTTERDPSRFGLAYRWAEAARKFRHHSVETAYEEAISLMQSSLVFGATLPIQHDRLVENSVLYKISLNYASYQIQKGRLKPSIETLEQGRSLLWSEMRGLRSSTDRLRAADPDLAERFTAIIQERERMLTTSALSNENVGMDDRMAQLPDLMGRQQELLKAQDALITEIRALPDLKDFLLPLPFDTLRSAASRGPVIIINHCEWRSDILIVLHDAPPSHVLTRYDFFDRAKRLKDELLNSREKHGLNSEHHEKVLSHVLMELYELVGRPVIERLKQLGIEEQSRVWWCPTSVFGYLPLHAMGPIPSDDGDQRYFMDLYVSSRTSTLSALIESREPSTQTSASLALLVAQPNPSLPGSWPNAEAIHDALKVTSLSSGDTTSTTVLDELQRHPFACVAYRGELKAGKPFEAVMRLPNGECLTLLDIVRSRHPGGESVVLPGPCTAELTDGSIPDEALYLSAAVQFSGFRSVIGTMWGMDDEPDAWQGLAEAVFKSTFKFSSTNGEAYYERSARALQHAVQEMRRSCLPLAQWANYVHHGA